MEFPADATQAMLAFLSRWLAEDEVRSWGFRNAAASEDRNQENHPAPHLPGSSGWAPVIA